MYGAEARVTVPPAETDVPGPAFGGLAKAGQRWFPVEERADNAALRQRLHDSAQIKDDTRIVGDQHGEIALLFDGVALALGMRRSGASREGPPHTPTTERLQPFGRVGMWRSPCGRPRVVIRLTMPMRRRGCRPRHADRARRPEGPGGGGFSGVFDRHWM